MKKVMGGQGSEPLSVMMAQEEKEDRARNVAKMRILRDRRDRKIGVRLPCGRCRIVFMLVNRTSFSSVQWERGNGQVLLMKVVVPFRAG